MGTAHNSANPGDIAKTVLMSGDPLRAKFVAEQFLENPVCFNEVRGMYGFTGTYRGKRLSVMGHGMGCSSVGIYTYELFHHYDVDNIIRFGSAGGLTDDVNLMDIVIASGAGTDSNFGQQYFFPKGYVPPASFELLETAVQTSRELNIPVKVGSVYSTDFFYHKDDAHEKMRDAGLLAVEMEAAALYINAAEAGKKALTILTISDHLFSGMELPPEQRQTGFLNMMKLALETAYKL